MTQLQTRLLKNTTGTGVYQFAVLKDKQSRAENSMWVCPRVVTLAPVQTICLADKPTSSVLARENQCFPREPTSCHWIRILGTSTPSKPEVDPIQGLDRAHNRYASEGKGLCRVFDANETFIQAIIAFSPRTLLTNVQF